MRKWRRLAWVAAGCLCAGSAGAQPGARPARDSLTPDDFAADFAFAWTAVRDGYAYLERSGVDWDRVRELYQARARSAESPRAFLQVMELAVAELHDPHAHLGANTAASPRLIPSDTDLWAEWRPEGAYVTDVRAGSAAERAGLRPGMRVVSVDGRPVEEAVAARMPRAVAPGDSAARGWALRAALAGYRDRPVEVGVAGGARPALHRFVPGVERPAAPLTARTLAGGVGYVRIHNSLGNAALVAAWDSALDALRGTRGLILDLRDTPGGGNTTVARALMGRLIEREAPYQRHELAAEERRYGVRRIWVEYVAPRGPFAYTAPVVVLAGRWTGSMGEGITIGLDGMRRATVVGSPMAALLGAVEVVTLPRTGITMRLPAERLLHVDGTPREAFVPSVRVYPDADPATDEVLDTGLRVLLQPR
jgi:C-terminal processing protease CtpA/Prc